MENVYEGEGYSNRAGHSNEGAEKLFDMVLLPTSNTQKNPSFTRNSKDKIVFDINY